MCCFAWLESRVQTVSTKGLSGAKEEYVILRLTAHGAGKREATLTFDVGQGTQDLGYRAEVPILFTKGIKERCPETGSPGISDQAQQGRGTST